MVNLNWEKPKTRHKAPNVVRMIEHFNDVKMWTASLIVGGKTPKARKTRMKKLIKICGYLKDMNNFNTLAAILQGLQDPSVERLKQSFALLANNSKDVSLGGNILLTCVNRHLEIYAN